MTYAVLKHALLPLGRALEVDLPIGSRVLSCAFQYGGEPVMWVLQRGNYSFADVGNVDEILMRRRFQVFETGKPLPPSKHLKFIGTMQRPDLHAHVVSRNYVLHLFELYEGDEP